MILKGVLKSYDDTTHRATVQILGSITSWLADVPVSHALMATDMVAGRYVAVLTPDPAKPGDAVVIALWTATTPPAAPTTQLSSTRVRLSSDQSVPTNTITQVEFDTVEWDTLSEYDDTNYEWVADHDGEYLLILSINAEALDDGDSVLAYIYRNSSTLEVSYQIVIAANSTWPMWQCTCVSQLDEGDTISGSFWHNHGSNRNINANRAKSFLVVRELP